MPEARLISVNVGKPREVGFRDGAVLTGIFKTLVAGRVAVHKLNLAGDRQADLTVHGGADKAVYCYPAEHYPHWAEELPGTELPYGMFGENLTTQVLDEASVYIGDRFRIGSAVPRVTQLRTPCYKLGIKFGRSDMVEKFRSSGRSGFYFSVIEEGELGAGDGIERVAIGPGAGERTRGFAARRRC
ncbi:MAG TPA: MOSC domain-containing protein [Terriglobales bacterium]|nr:MOSC domain-containing protein [Terriglobales bacterium]